MTATISETIKFNGGGSLDIKYIDQLPDSYTVVRMKEIDAISLIVIFNQLWGSNLN